LMDLVYTGTCTCTGAEVQEVQHLTTILGMHGVQVGEEEVEKMVQEKVEPVEESLEESTTFLYVEDSPVELKCDQEYTMEVGPMGVLEGVEEVEVIEAVDEVEVFGDAEELGGLERCGENLAMLEVQEVEIQEAEVLEEVEEVQALAVGSSPSAGKVQCPSCSKVLSARHYRKHHRAACSGELVLACGLCGRRGFATAATLQDHVRARHTADRPYSCDICGKAFPATSHLAHHRTKKHQVNYKGESLPKLTFPCTECDKSLTTKPKLQAHIRVVHRGIKDHVCPQCHKSFSSKSNLYIHIGSVHTGVLPHKCHSCDKTFTKKSLLEQHRTSVHKFSEVQNITPVMV